VPGVTQVEVEMMAVAAVEAVGAVPRVDDRDEVEAEDDDHDDPYDPPGYLGHPRSHPTSHPSRILEFWESASHLGSSGFTTTFTYDVTRSRTIGARPRNCQCHHDQ